MLRIQRNFGSRLKNKLKPDSIAFVQYPNGKSDPGAQRSRFCSCCEKRRSESACVRDSLQYIISVWQCIRTYDKGNHSTNQSSGEVNDYNTRYTASSIPKPHASCLDDIEYSAHRTTRTSGSPRRITTVDQRAKRTQERDRY